MGDTKVELGDDVAVSHARHVHKNDFQLRGGTTAHAGAPPAGGPEAKRCSAELTVTL